jgi:uncharacterized protein (TIGR02217 family)
MTRKNVIMTFHEIRFPTSVAFHSTGAPERRTEIVTLGSGFEERNGVWAHSRRRYDVGTGVKTLADIHAVIAFFEARRGRLYGFRFKDFTDFRSAAASVTPRDQTIATGDGTTKSFQLMKTYPSGPASWCRVIKKPVAGSVRMAVAGVEQSAFTVDTATGLVTFATAPPAGSAITAGFEFDVPVRFDSDSLSINLAHFEAGEIPSIPIVEIRV